ncbi:hypothetical protein Tco_0015927 [Tanacetum coccineum]
MAAKVPQTLEYGGGQLNAAPVLKDFQDSPDDEEDVRSSQEYMNDLEEEYQTRALLAKSKRFFKRVIKVSPDEETKVKALMELVDDKRVSVGKESASNGEWVKISIQKVHTLLEMEDNDDRKSFLDYLCIDINYVEEQRNNLLSKHRNLVQELNTLMQNQAASTSVKSPTKNDWDLLFQPMFDEYFKPPSVVSTSISVATLPHQ